MALPLSIFILSGSEADSETLRVALHSRPGVTAVEVEASTQAIDVRLQNDASSWDAIIVDLYSLPSLESTVDWIFAVRTKYPDVVFALFSRQEELDNLPNVADVKKQRLAHYYRLSKDTPLSAWAFAIDRLLLQFSNYRIAHGTRRDALAIRAELENFGNETVRIRTEAALSRVIESADAALMPLPAPSDRIAGSFAPFVFVEAAEFQKLVLDTVSRATVTLKRASQIQIFVLAFGALLIAVAFAAALMSNSVALLGFGGIGLGGVIAALVTQPLGSITDEARKLVQLQIGYLGFLSLIQIASDIAAEEKEYVVLEKMGEEVRRLMDQLSRI